MRRLSEAIYDHYLLNPSLADLVTDFFHTEAPKETDFPYGTFSLVITDKENWFNAKIPISQVRFNFFSESENSVEVEDIAEAFNDAYDEKNLKLSGGLEYGWCEFMAETQQKVDAVWQQSILYKVTMIKAD